MPGQRVVITGHEKGLIGPRLLSGLSTRGFDARRVAFDVTDASAVASGLRGQAADAVIHLAAISNPKECEEHPARAASVNVAGTGNVIEAMKKELPRARLYFASTMYVYSAVQERESPAVIDENRAIEPQKTYGRTKWEAETLIAAAAQRGQLSATVLRLFNHTHKTQLPGFFMSDMYQQLLALKPAGHGDVKAGNLEISRDFGAVDDLVEAFAALLRRPRAGEGLETFNLCSGTPKRLAQLARELAARLGVDARFVTDPARVRPGEPESIVGSHRRLTEATGWEPRCKTEAALVERFLAD